MIHISSFNLRTESKVEKKKKASLSEFQKPRRELSQTYKAPVYVLLCHPPRYRGMDQVHQGLQT